MRKISSAQRSIHKKREKDGSALKRCKFLKVYCSLTSGSLLRNFNAFKIHKITQLLINRTKEDFNETFSDKNLS